MASDILIAVNDQGSLSYSRIDPVNMTTIEIPVNSIQDSPSTYTFVFQDPKALEKIFKCSTPSNRYLVDEMRKLRLDILQTISAAQLTPLEENGGIDGPNMSPLVENWRSACRSIPKGHQIEEIIFNMSCGQQIEIRHIVRLLQQISTTIMIKGSSPFRCQVQGCDAEKKAWLEASLVSA
ncbi:uncharacterized protein N7498_007637 [Penicillium cinerascens]|uniref:Uncharacterized protein n=1 Tax=Penicillium cinerascens TaxID=70096 RepID=A0A9W9MDJ8_9EURO|nr:uncharacterized protein N7498_007637 [Penicillium cinerascens]KAJ5198520.1 hypothetical protein N7498_007637 [Penicillium cinerascens]